MPFCPNCGKENPEGASFCTNCGTRLAAEESPSKQTEESNAEPKQETVPEPVPETHKESGPAFTAPAASPSGMAERNIILFVILALCTCGIGALVWMYLLVEDLNKAADHPDAPNGLVVILLSLVTCGIYQIYWFWKAGEAVNTIRGKRGEATDSNLSLVYLILSLVGLSIVNLALIQDELNKAARS